MNDQAVSKPAMVWQVCYITRKKSVSFSICAVSLVFDSLITMRRTKPL